MAQPSQERGCLGGVVFCAPAEEDVGCWASRAPLPSSGGRKGVTTACAKAKPWVTEWDVSLVFLEGGLSCKAASEQAPWALESRPAQLELRS